MVSQRINAGEKRREQGQIEHDAMVEKRLTNKEEANTKKEAIEKEKQEAKKKELDE